METPEHEQERYCDASPGNVKEDGLRKLAIGVDRDSLESKCVM